MSKQVVCVAQTERLEISYFNPSSSKSIAILMGLDDGLPWKAYSIRFDVILFPLAVGLRRRSCMVVEDLLPRLIAVSRDILKEKGLKAFKITG
jgi:hypothetical protein